MKPSACRQELCQPNKHKPSLTKYTEIVVSAGNYFLQSWGLSQKPSQHFIPVWVPEVHFELHCHSLKVSSKSLCYWGINFVAVELSFKSVTISGRFCFREKVGGDSYSTLSKDQVPLNEALGCDLESAFCNVFLCSVYVNIFKRSCRNQMLSFIRNEHFLAYYFTGISIFHTEMSEF